MVPRITAHICLFYWQDTPLIVLDLVLDNPVLVLLTGFQRVPWLIFTRFRGEGRVGFERV